MKRVRLKREDALCWLIICGLGLIYRVEIAAAFDRLFLSLFGKTISGRMWLVQVLFYGTVFLICLLLPVAP